MLERYESGKISVTFGSNIVIGSGTRWKTYVYPAWILTCGGYVEAIQSIENNWTMTLANTWAGETRTLSFYVIDRVETKTEMLAHLLGQIEAMKAKKKDEDFFYNGNNYFADYYAIVGTANVCLAMEASAAIPTPPPITGYWKTADIDGAGNPVMVLYTAAAFAGLSRAYYDRDAALWATATAHKTNLVAIEQDPSKTIEDLLNYDLEAGW